MARRKIYKGHQITTVDRRTGALAWFHANEIRGTSFRVTRPTDVMGIFGYWLKTAHEGTGWCRGHVTEDSEDGRALLAAYTMQ